MKFKNSNYFTESNYLAKNAEIIFFLLLGANRMITPSGSIEALEGR